MKLESKREMKNPEEGGRRCRSSRKKKARFSSVCPPHRRGQSMNTKPLFKLMVEKKASDLFFTCNAPVKIKIEGKIFPVNKQVLSPETVRQAALGLMTQDQIEHFNEELEIDFAISEPGLGRFRVNVFYQRGYPAMVLRYITAEMPKLEDLGMPEILKELVMLKRGLILMVGAAGAGKSDHARRDDQPPQRDLVGPHPHHRGSDRVPAHQQEIDRQSARGRARHEVLRARAAQRRARGARRDPGRRDPRPRDHGGGASRWPAPATCASRRCTPTTAPRRSTASSTCSRATSTTRSSSTCRSTCAPSSRSGWCVAKTGSRVAASEVMVNTPHVSELIKKGDVVGVRKRSAPAPSAAC